jgi:hypothetical protein
MPVAVFTPAVSPAAGSIVETSVIGVGEWLPVAIVLLARFAKIICVSMRQVALRSPVILLPVRIAEKLVMAVVAPSIVRPRARRPDGNV